MVEWWFNGDKYKHDKNGGLSLRMFNDGDQMWWMMNGSFMMIDGDSWN